MSYMDIRDVIKKLLDIVSGREFYVDCIDAHFRAGNYSDEICKLCNILSNFEGGINHQIDEAVHNIIDYLKEMRSIGYLLYDYSRDRYRGNLVVEVDIWKDKNKLKELKEEWYMYKEDLLNNCKLVLEKLDELFNNKFIILLGVN